MIRMLRNFGALESILLEGSPGFVWVEDGQILGNVGMQRNPTRRDTWVIGNVATHPAHRNRGIASALLSAIIHYAHVRGAEEARKDGVAKLAAWNTAPASAVLPETLAVSRDQPQKQPMPLVDAALRIDAATLPALTGRHAW